MLLRRVAALALFVGIGFAIADSAPALASEAVPHPQIVRETHSVMGAPLEISVEAPTRELGQRWIRDAVAVGRRIDRELSSWKANSNLWQLNLAAGRGPQTVVTSLHEVLTLAAEISKDTGARFDVTVGAVLGPPVEVSRLERPGDIKSRRKCIDARDVRLMDKSRVALAKKCTLIDLRGIGKGYAAERMASELRGYGVTRGLVDFGQSSVIAIGPSEPESPVEFGVRRGERFVGSVYLRNTTLSISETLRGDEANDQGKPHIIDPRTGEFVRELRTAVVIGADAGKGEGWSIALIVEPKATMALVEKHSDLEAMVFDGDNVLQSSGFVAAAGWVATNR